MNLSRRLMGKCLVLAVMASVAFAGAAAEAAVKEWRFDCGTADSAVTSGYRRLTAGDTYDATRGHGWEGAKPQGVVFGPPKSPHPRRGLSWELDYVKENTNDLNRDGVVSPEDLVFRSDVPNGVYRVTVTIGDLSEPLGSIDVLMNGKLVGEHVAAWTPGIYRQFHNTPIGWWTYVRGTVEVKDGIVRIALKKNQAYYDEQMAEQMTWENPTSVYWRKSWNEKNPPYFYVGFPFIRNSIMAIEILPFMASPVAGENDKLRATRPLPSQALNEAIAEFNSEDFAGALKALEKVREPEAKVGKAIVQLWLAGRPEVEMEEELVPAALKVLQEYVAAHPEENGVAEVLQDAEIFQKALTTHLTRGQIRIINGEAVQRNHFIENDKAIGWWWLIKEDSPLYYKSQLYIARAGHMLMPYIPVLGTAADILKKLERKFPDNRYVKYLLHWQWEPYGDGSHFHDWQVVDYLSRSEGAPEWARQLQAAWATQVDWCEWWIKFKQRPEGNIGGGWGDDVEVVGAFGYMGYVSKGVSDLLIQGTRNLVEGMWNLSEVDPEIGYCLPMADAEHTAEWTGNTLGMMVQIDHGNPVWIERSLKTAKLMRDLWTDYDKNGHRHFRANYFGASQVGGGDQMNDSWINCRAIRPAAAVLRYNQNPAISKWFAEMGDAWLAAAMSNERGKPGGVIPAQVSFPDGILGGTNSPNWYTASHPRGTVNYDWAGVRGQAYKDYIQDMLLTAYRQTGNKQYLDPLRLEYELAARHGNAPEIQVGGRLTRQPWVRPTEDFRDGLRLVLEKWQPSSMKAAAIQEKPGEKTQAPPAEAEEGSEQWVAANLKGVDQWLVAKRILEGRKGPLENDITRDQITEHMTFLNHMLKMRWPLDTSEASATDRLGFPGWPSSFFVCTGGRQGGAFFEAAVTYENTTKNYAGAVMASDPQGLRILYYSMSPGKREVGIVPWELEPSGKYRLTYGPDANEDEVMDRVLETREFVFPQQGTPIHVTVEPRVTYVIEVDQLERGRVAGLAPDPGLSARDIRYDERYSLILARVHNVGSKLVRNVKVAFYDGDPNAGGSQIATSLIPNIEAPNDLEPRSVAVGINWSPSKEAHDIYVVVDPDDEIKDEITTFNNVTHATLPREEKAAPAKAAPVVPAAGRGRG